MTTNAEAFDTQLCEIVPTLQRRAFRYCKSEADAADLVQKTLERALTYRLKFEMGTNMSAWLSTIMRNTYINQWRRRQKHNELVDRGYIEPPSEAVRPDAGDGTREALQILKTLREGLHKTYFETLRLSDFEGKSYREIAEQMDVPLGTVMSRLYRARRKARAIVCKVYDTELLADALDTDVSEIAKAHA